MMNPDGSINTMGWIDLSYLATDEAVQPALSIIYQEVVRP